MTLLPERPVYLAMSRWSTPDGEKTIFIRKFTKTSVTNRVKQWREGKPYLYVGFSGNPYEDWTLIDVHFSEGKIVWIEKELPPETEPDPAKVELLPKKKPKSIHPQGIYTSHPHKEASSWTDVKKKMVWPSWTDPFSYNNPKLSDPTEEAKKWL